jgi:cephalosporin-C deacetylase-like acetyl esterase
MAIRAFDKYFWNLPKLTKEDDFQKFWEKSVSEIKKIPIEPEVHENHRKYTSRFKAYDVSYNGFLKARIKGILYSPKKLEKSRVIIHIHDYNRYPEKGLIKMLSDNTAHLFLVMRGHDIIEHRTEEELEQNRPLGFIVENIIDMETYYARSVYLDVYRSIDFLRLINFIDCNKIGIFGKGFGAAAGFFTAVFSPRVGAVVLDSPLFCNLPLSQNISESDTSREINDIINVQRSKKSQIKKNLSYFDIINFSHDLQCPTLFVTGLKDMISPPECVMGLFNNIQSEKTIEVFPDDGNEAGGDNQRVKSVNWLIDKILTD